MTNNTAQTPDMDPLEPGSSTNMDLTDDSHPLQHASPIPKHPQNQALKRKRSYGTLSEPIELSDSEDNAEPADTRMDHMGYEWVDLTREPDHVYTLNDCLQHALEIFPDISHDYVMRLWHEQTLSPDGALRIQEVLALVTEANTYPKQKDLQAQIWQTGATDEAEIDLDTLRGTKDYEKTSVIKLSNEFPHLSKSCVAAAYHKHKKICPTFTELKEGEESGVLRKKRLRRPPVQLPTERSQRGHFLAMAADQELTLAKSKWTTAQRESPPIPESFPVLTNSPEQKAAQEEAAQVEAANEEEARTAGMMQQCETCWSEVPRNRTTTCDAEEAHYTCFDCTNTHVQVELGRSRCLIKCTICPAKIAEQQLRLCVPEKILDRLSREQQLQEVREASIPGLTECPFCHYAADYPPVEIDVEFRCQHPDCGKVTCRKCYKYTHVPLSCKEAADKKRLDDDIDACHVVEEAMTDALLRNCNKCKTRFYKEGGCNMMTCPTCRNHQCYRCHETILDHSHFTRSPGDGNCPQFDKAGELEEIHRAEVTSAAITSSEKVLAERPHVNLGNLAAIQLPEAPVVGSMTVRPAIEELSQAPRQNHYGFPLQTGATGVPGLPEANQHQEGFQNILMQQAALNMRQNPFGTHAYGAHDWTRAFEAAMNARNWPNNGPPRVTMNFSNPAGEAITKLQNGPNDSPPGVAPNLNNRAGETSMNLPNRPVNSPPSVTTGYNSRAGETSMNSSSRPNNSPPSVTTSFNSRAVETSMNSSSRPNNGPPSVTTSFNSRAGETSMNLPKRPNSPPGVTSNFSNRAGIASMNLQNRPYIGPPRRTANGMPVVFNAPPMVPRPHQRRSQGVSYVNVGTSETPDPVTLERMGALRLSAQHVQHPFQFAARMGLGRIDPVTRMATPVHIRSTANGLQMDMEQVDPTTAMATPTHFQRIVAMGFEQIDPVTDMPPPIRVQNTDGVLQWSMGQTDLAPLMAAPIRFESTAPITPFGSADDFSRTPTAMMPSTQAPPLN